MIEIFNKESVVYIKNSDNICITLDTLSQIVKIDTYMIDFPWEYEKSWILLEVKEYEWKLFYSFLIEWKVVFVLFHDTFELKEEIMSFFWDIDILLIIGSKLSAKIVENMEARVVIPFWEWKELFLHTLSQHKEEIQNFKLKWEMGIETTEYIHLQ